VGSTGIFAASGATITNETDGVISGYYRIDSPGDAFTVTNLGTITGSLGDATGVNSFDVGGPSRSPTGPPPPAMSPASRTPGSTRST